MSAVKRQAIRTGGWHNPSRGGERKYYDSAVVATTLAAAGTFVLPGLLNPMVPGSGANNRIGRKVVMKSLYIRWTANLQPTSTGGSPIRMIIFYDKQANAAQANATDLLVQNLFQSPNNLDNRDRFVVIADQTSDTVSVGNNYSIAGQCYKKINLETIYNAGSAGTIGDIQSGALYVTFAQTNGNVGTAQPQITWYARLRYEDN